MKRNRPNSTRADKLVFIHSNIRLQSRFTASYKDGPYKKWDIDPEHTSIDDSIVRLEDMRWRCLDNNGGNISGFDTRKDDDVPSSQVSKAPSIAKSTSQISSPLLVSRPNHHQTSIATFAKGTSSNDKGKGKQQY